MISAFKSSWHDMATATAKVAADKGFHAELPNAAVMIALVHSELSEALEVLRNNPQETDPTCPGFLKVETELADVIIRLMNMAYRFAWDVPGAVLAKHEYNKTRPHKHGKLF